MDLDSRVFQDRMVNNEDREWFKQLIDATAQAKFAGVGWDTVAGSGCSRGAPA